MGDCTFTTQVHEDDELVCRNPAEVVYKGEALCAECAYQVMPVPAN